MQPDRLRIAWNCGMRLTKAVDYCARHNISKEKVVSFWRSTYKRVGYLGSLPNPTFYQNKGLAFTYCDDEEIAPGVWYCKQKNLWWKDGRVYCEQSAWHNGLTGTGAYFKQILKENN